MNIILFGCCSSPYACTMAWFGITLHHTDRDLNGGWRPTSYTDMCTFSQVSHNNVCIVWPHAKAADTNDAQMACMSHMQKGWSKGRADTSFADANLNLPYKKLRSQNARVCRHACAGTVDTPSSGTPVLLKHDAAPQIAQLYTYSYSSLLPRLYWLYPGA